MRAIRWILSVLLAVTAVLFIGNTIYERASGQSVGPQIQCPEEVLEVSVHDPESALLAGVTASDAQDGDLTGRVIVGGVSNLTGGDTANVTLLVFDSHDNMASWVRQIRYTDYHRPRIRLTQPLRFANEDDAKLLSYVIAEDVMDGDLSGQVRVSTLWATGEEGVFSATLRVTNSLGDMAAVEVPVIIRSGSGSIRLRSQILYLEQGGSFDPKAQVTSDRTGLTVRSEVDMETPGCYWVWYEKGDDLAILTVVVE